MSILTPNERLLNNDVQDENLLIVLSNHNRKCSLSYRPMNEFGAQSIVTHVAIKPSTS